MNSAFPNETFGPKIEIYLGQNKFESNVCRILLQQDDVLLRVTEPPFLSALRAKNDTTNLSDYKLGESTENNEALLFFSGKKTIQTFNISI